jgi:hypothetical protein
MVKGETVMARKVVEGIDRYKVLEELVKKADTPEQVHLLMDMNVDRTAGLIKEIYELQGQVSGYRKAFEELADKIVYYKRMEQE